MTLLLYNSLSKQMEPFRPLKGRTVRMYTCGPTVYDYAHIGNLRSYIFADVLKRVLLANRYRVRHVMNITDVGHLTDDADAGEDKVEVAAGRQEKTASEIAVYYTQEFLRDLQQLNVLPADKMPRATEYIAEQIALVRVLEQEGYTYRTSDGVYFDASKFAPYGRAFGGQALTEKAAGARVEVRSTKRSPHDFALWKFTPPGVKRQMEWESPWGVGFPGWHLECSAMSRALLGQPFDIHTGGVDHIPVHHTNEIAQSEAAYGQPLAAFWLHGAFLTVDGGRMGKSEGNLITIAQLMERGFDPLAYRLFVLGAHYRSPLNFTWEALGAAAQALEHLRERCSELPKPPVRIHATIKPIVQERTERFLSACNDDLDTPKALALLWDVVKGSRDPRAQSAIIAYADQVFGLGICDVLGVPVAIPREVHDLVAAREAARTTKQWARADVLRAQIQAMGFLVEDTQNGPKIRARGKKGH